MYAAGTVAVYLVPSPIGTNIERFAEYAAPVALLLALLAQPRLRGVRRGALVAVLVYSVAWTGQKPSTT